MLRVIITKKPTSVNHSDIIILGATIISYIIVSIMMSLRHHTIDTDRKDDDNNSSSSNCSDNNNNNIDTNISDYDGIVRDDVVVSITQQQQHHHHNNTIFLQCISYVFGFGPDTPIEATGLSIDIFARATISMSSMFIGPALLQLASDAAGCPQPNEGDNNSDTDECTNRIYGFRPSSLLSNIAVASGLIGCIALPIFGSIVDHTQYRREVGAYTAALLTLLKGIEISIGPTTWFYIAILQVIAGFLYNFHLTATYAYISELSSDSTIQSNYNSSFYVVMYISCLIFLITVVGTSSFLHLNDVGTSRISQCVTTAVCTIAFTIAWRYYFTNRSARSQIPDGMNVITCGIIKSFQTSKDIVTNNLPLSLLLVSIAFSEAAAMTIITVSTTYMKLYLQMNASEIGVIFLCVLLSGIPGSLIGNFVTKSFQCPMISILMCDIFYVVSTIVATLVLTGPEPRDKTYIFGIAWGIGLGWLHPQHTTAFISLLQSKGQEAELMGIYLLATQILGWLPPLVFTALNEAGYPMTLGLGSLTIFFAVGITCIILVKIVQYRTTSITTIDYDKNSGHPIGNSSPISKYEQIPSSSNLDVSERSSYQHSSKTSLELPPLS